MVSRTWVSFSNYAYLLTELSSLKLLLPVSETRISLSNYPYLLTVLPSLKPLPLPLVRKLRLVMIAFWLININSYQNLQLDSGETVCPLKVPQLQEPPQSQDRHVPISGSAAYWYNDEITFPVNILGLKKFGQFLLVRQSYKDHTIWLSNINQPSPHSCCYGASSECRRQCCYLDVADTGPKATPAISGTTEAVVKIAEVPIIPVEDCGNYIIVGTTGKWSSSSARFSVLKPHRHR